MAADWTTIRANVEAAIAGYAATLAAVAADDPKTSYSVGDQSFQWTEYQTFLIKAIADAQALLQTLGGPFQVVTRVKG